MRKPLLYRSLYDLIARGFKDHLDSTGEFAFAEFKAAAAIDRRAVGLRVYHNPERRLS
jgi:hypothetical protein